jgi:hypothetical protein
MGGYFGKDFVFLETESSTKPSSMHPMILSSKGPVKKTNENREESRELMLSKSAED